MKPEIENLNDAEPNTTYYLHRDLCQKVAKATALEEWEARESIGRQLQSAIPDWTKAPEFFKFGIWQGATGAAFDYNREPDFILVLERCPMPLGLDFKVAYKFKEQLRP